MESRSERSQTISRNSEIFLHFTRANLFSMSFVVLLLVFMIPLVLEWSTDHFFLIGGMLGTISSSVVIVIYIRNPTKRTSSLSLLFFRAFCDMGIGLRFIFNFAVNFTICNSSHCSINDITDIKEAENKCGPSAGALEFFEMASEAWFFCLAVDLAVSITNPFSSFKDRLKYYHTFCWTFALIMGLLLAFVNDWSGFWVVDEAVDDTAICWIKVKAGENVYAINYRPWIMLYIPLLLVYMYSLYVLLKAYSHLKRGISKTFQHRVKVLVQNSINIGIYMGYWAMLLFLYFMSYILVSSESAASWFWKCLLFGLSSKGFADLLVFILVSDANPAESDVIRKGEPMDLNSALRQEVLFFATTGIRECANQQCMDINKRKIVILMNQSTGIEENILTLNNLIRLVFNGENTVIESDEQMEFSNQNQTNIVHVDEMDSAFDRESFSNKANDQDHGIANALSFSFGKFSSKDKGGERTPKRVSNSLMNVSMIMSNTDSTGGIHDKDEEGSIFFRDMSYWFISLFQGENDGNVVFSEYEPYHCRRIRLSAGVNDADYITSFMATIKERLTEGGASGAFFFFTKDETFIAKSCTVEEFIHIRKSASILANYFEENPHSFITKIYGIYRLVIYGTVLYFFVTNNIFLNPDDEVINEKYDLKGSTVNRNSKLPQVGERVTCTYCNQKYIFVNYKKLRKKKGKVEAVEADVESGKGVKPTVSRCRQHVLGEHEPNVILKDNDLKHKIRLPRETALFLHQQLTKDSAILCSLDVMDYSLLVGVHNTEYLVEDSFVSRNSSATFLAPRNTISPVGNIGGPLRKPSIIIRKPKSVQDTDEREEKKEKYGGSWDSGENSNSLKSSFEIEIDDDNGRAAPISQGNSGKSNVISYNDTSRHTNALENTNYIPVKGRLTVSRVVGPEAYYMGIVDYQQKWNWDKKSERFLKIHLKGDSPEGLSAIEPVAYRQRFLRRMEDLLDLDDGV